MVEFLLPQEKLDCRQKFKEDPLPKENEVALFKENGPAPGRLKEKDTRDSDFCGNSVVLKEVGALDS